MGKKWNVLFVFAFILISHHSMAQDQSAPLEKVEVEASFPGGQAAWNKYITQQLMLHVNDFTTRDVGTCTIRFIVDINGETKDVEATNMKRTKLAKASIEAIENGPRWIPAQQDGKAVNAYRIQPVSLQSGN